MSPAIPHTCALPDYLRQHVEIALPLPVGHGREEALPLVALVVHEHVVEGPRKPALHDLVLLQRVERLAEVSGDARNLAALGEHVVDVPLLRRPRIELSLDAVEARPQQRRLRQIRIASRIDGAVLEPAAARDTDEARAVLP